jgi:hypothetical protein
VNQDSQAGCASNESKDGDMTIDAISKVQHWQGPNLLLFWHGAPATIGPRDGSIAGSCRQKATLQILGCASKCTGDKPNAFCYSDCKAKRINWFRYGMYDIYEE